MIFQSLDSRNCVNESVAISLRTMEDLGTKQYREFITKVLEDCTASIHKIILLSTSDDNIEAWKEDQSAAEQCSTLWPVIHIHAKS